MGYLVQVCFALRSYEWRRETSQFLIQRTCWRKFCIPAAGMILTMLNHSTVPSRIASKVTIYIQMSCFDVFWTPISSDCHYHRSLNYDGILLSTKNAIELIMVGLVSSDCIIVNASWSARKKEIIWIVKFLTCSRRRSRDLFYFCRPTPLWRTYLTLFSISALAGGCSSELPLSTTVWRRWCNFFYWLSSFADWGEIFSPLCRLQPLEEWIRVQRGSTVVGGDTRRVFDCNFSRILSRERTFLHLDVHGPCSVLRNWLLVSTRPLHWLDWNGPTHSRSNFMTMR